MEDSGAILCQISSLKDMLDQVNEEIEESIQRTREIESEIVKCTEIEKDYLSREADLAKMVSISDFELSGFVHVAVIGRKRVELMDKELRSLKTDLEEITKRISEKREKFVTLCSHFQMDIRKGENEELRLLLLEKEVLESEECNLNLKISALRNSTKEYIEELINEIQSSSSVLEVELRCCGSENNVLQNDIDDLKTLLHSLIQTEDSPAQI